jgi:hypothetical protein
VAAGDGFVIKPTGLVADPSWLELRASDPARVVGFPAFWVQVCAFSGGSYDCDALGPTIDPDAPDRELRVDGARREIFGNDGWHDCAATSCFVLARVNIVESVTPDGLNGSDRAVAAAPIVLDPAVPAAPRPTLLLSPDGPYHDGQQVSVRAEHVPPGQTDIQIAICHQDPAVHNDCGYLGFPEVVDGAAEAIVPLPRTTTFFDCAQVACFVTLMRGGEGLGPLATVPIRFTT